MTGRIAFAAAVAIASSIATLIALFPVTRNLSKIQDLDPLLEWFWSESIPRLIVAVLFIFIALTLRETKPLAAMFLVLATIPLMFTLDLALRILR